MFSVNNLRLGTITATDYCLGSVPVQKMYLGSVLVFNRTPAEEVKYFFEVSPSEDMEFEALDSEKTLTVTSYSQVYSGDSPSGSVTPITPTIYKPDWITSDIVNNSDGTFTITLKANDYYQDEDGSLSERSYTITILLGSSTYSTKIRVSQSPIIPTVLNRWLRLEYAAEEDQYITVNKANVELPYVSDWKNYVFPKKSTGIKPIRWNADITNQDFMHEVLVYMSELTIIYVDEAENAQENKSTYTAADNMCIATSNGDGLYFLELLKDSGIENGEITFKIDGNGLWGQFYECFAGCSFNKVTIQFMQDNICISSMNRAFRACTIKELNILDANGDPVTTKHFAARDLSGMCEWFYGLTEFPDIIDWESLDQNFTTGFGWAFSYASQFTSIAQYGDDREASSNTIRCGTFIQSFLRCSSLQSIGPVLDLSRVPGLSSDNGKAFEQCTALTDVRIRNLNGPTWHFDDDTLSGNIPNLDQASVTYLFDNLMDLTTYNAEDTSGTKPKSDHGDLYCPAEWQDKITSEMIITAAAKNWNIYIGGELQTTESKVYTLTVEPTEATLTGVEGDNETTFTVNTYYQNVINGVVQDAKIHQTVQFDTHGMNEDSVVLYSNNNNNNTYSCRVTCNTASINRDYTITITQDDSGKSIEFVLHKVDPTITYGDINITGFTYPDPVSAAGETVTPTLTYSQTYGYNGTTTGGGTITSGATVTYSGTFVDASTGKIIVPSKGTTVSGETTVSEVTVHVSMNSKTASETFTVKQEANTATYGEVTGGTATANDILASGGTVEATVTKDATQTVSFTSGSTRSGNITTSATEVSAPSLSTTVKDRTQVGTSVLTFTGEGGKTQNVSVAVYQLANEITNTTYKDAQILLEANPMTIPATGGTSELTTYATRTRVNTYTSKATKEVSESAAPYTSIEGEGFSLSASSAMNITVTAEQNTGAQRTATITSVGYGVTETLTITQESGQTVSSYGDITINGGSATDIPASGGTVKASGCTATIEVTYSSGSTGTVTVPTQNITYTEVSAESLGTTVKARTKVGTSTCNVSYQGKSASKQIDVYQAANTVSYSDLTIVNPQVTEDIPASGGSISATYRSIIIKAEYSSGASETEEVVPSEANITSTKVTAVSLGTTEKARTKVGVSTISSSYQGLSTSEDVDVYQEANIKTEGEVKNGELTPVFEVEKYTANVTGDEIDFTVYANVEQSRTDSYTSGSTQVVDLGTTKVYPASNIFTPPGLHDDLNRVDWVTRDLADVGSSYQYKAIVEANTTSSSRQFVIDCWYEQSRSYAQSDPITQGSGKIMYGKAVVSDIVLNDAPAKGVSISNSSAGGGGYYNSINDEPYLVSCTVTQTWGYGLTTGGGTDVWHYPEDDRELTPSEYYTDAEGNVSSSTQLTIPSLGTTTKSRSKLPGNYAVLFISVGADSDRGDCIGYSEWYQEANTRTAGDIQYGEWQVNVSANPNTIDSNGGVRTITRTATRTRTQQYNYTSGATSSAALSNETGTPTLSSNQTWATVDGNNVTIAKNTTTSSRTVTITGTYQGKTDTCTITQSGMQIESYGDITISGGSVSGDIPASGGSKSASGCTATIRVNYDNDTYENVSVPSSNISYSSVSGSNLGTTSKARTKVGTSRCTVTYQGKTATKDFDVYQLANSSTATDISYGTWLVNVSANPTSVAASGGTSTITRSASRTRKQNYTWTSGATSQSDMANETATPTLSVSGTGFSLNGTTVTATSNIPARNYTLQVSNPTGDLEEGPDQELTTTVTSTYTQPSSNSRSCTVTATHGGVSKQVTISLSGQSQSSGNQDWTVAKGTNMLTATKSGNTLTIIPNAEYGNKNETYTATCTVTQTVSNKTATVIGTWYKGYLNVSPATLDFTADGGTEIINIDTNLNWQVMP